eukprot:4605029-Pyramimonas_sp.AAC.1
MSWSDNRGVGTVRAQRGHLAGGGDAGKLRGGLAGGGDGRGVVVGGVGGHFKVEAGLKQRGVEHPVVVLLLKRPPVPSRHVS